MKRGGPIRPVSAKRQARNRAYAKTRQVVIERAGGRCEVCQRAFITDVHHVLRRSQGGTDDPDNLRGLCGPCHAWVHANPAAAVAAGLLRKANESA